MQHSQTHAVVPITFHSSSHISPALSVWVNESQRYRIRCTALSAGLSTTPYLLLFYLTLSLFFFFSGFVIFHTLAHICFAIISTAAFIYGYLPPSHFASCISPCFGSFALSAKANHTNYCCSCDITHIAYLPSNACTNTRSVHQFAFLLLSFSLFFLLHTQLNLSSFSVSLHCPPPPQLSTAFISQLERSLTRRTPPLHFISCSSI